MKRSLLAIAIAASASFLAAPASADHCGETLQPPCETCVEYFTDRRLVCVPIALHLPA